ncbi:MAG TPA: homogentisate 1,2-dioxygenase [Roseiflexaceae bacterium]|nr:homogentisate 1,2-dioxygenase [Roseiflexaceae bacterium]
MPSYHMLGRVPAKRHSVFRDERDNLLYEEVFGTEGFSGIYSILYHRHLPPASRRNEVIGPVAPHPAPLSPHRHRHVKTKQLEPGGDPVSGRRVLMFNRDVALAVAAPRGPMVNATGEPYFYKNGVNDELLFIHEGEGVLETQLGDLDFRAGDYVYVPRGVIHRLSFQGDAGRMLVIEAAGAISVPKKYRNPFGQLLEHAPYWERDFRRPARLQTRDERGAFELHLKLDGVLYRRILDYHPFDVVGWDGHLYPWAFSIHDYEPHAGRFHVPPTTHQTFEGPNFVVCSFVPRQIDWDPQAVPIPYFHSNLDSDEVIYYVAGNYAARRGIEIGSITYHPRGLPHGPQAGAMEAALGAPRVTNELAVMVDTFHGLQLTDLMDAIDDPAYPDSWTR